MLTLCLVTNNAILRSLSYYSFQEYSEKIDILTKIGKKKEIQYSIM